MSLRDPMGQMATAQKLSITQLQQALRDGTINPQIGQIVLAAKIKKDKDDKLAMAAQAPKQPTVAEQNMAYGIDNMPSNLPVAGMAGGGIIAFDDGGEVKHYKVGGSGKDDTEDDAYGDWISQPTVFGSPYRGMVNAANYIGDLSGEAVDAVKGLAWTTDPKTGKLIRVADLKAQPRVAAAKAHKAMVDQAGTDVANQFRGNQVQPSLGSVPIGSITDALRTGEANPLLASAERGPAAKPTDTTSGIDSYFPGRQSSYFGVKGSQGIGGFNPKGYKVTPYDDKELKAIYQSELNPKTQQPWTYEDIAKRNRAEQEAAGIDFGLYKKQQDELDKLKTRSAERTNLEDATPWFAMAERLTQRPKAGEAAEPVFGTLMGGLGAYGKSKADIMDKREARDERIMDKGNALALAQNAFNQAQYTGNKADLKAAEADLKAARMGLANLGIKTVDQQNKVAEDVFKANVELEKTRMAESGAWARQGRDQQTVVSLAKMIQADAAKAGAPITDSEAMNKAYQMSKFQGSMYGADLKADANKTTAYNNWVKDNKLLLMSQGKPVPTQAEWEAMQGMGAGTNSVSVPGDITDIMNKYR